MPRRAAVVLVLYAVLAVVVIPVFPHFVSPNEVSRWVLAAALVDRHSVEVTPYASLVGSRFEDLSLVNGRLYSNKAPGGTLVGLPGYAAARLVVGPASGSTMRISLTAMRLGAATVPALFLGFLFIRAGARLGATDNRIAFALCILLFGTPLFAYGLLNFAHALGAAGLFGAWVLLFTLPGQRGTSARSETGDRPGTIPLLDRQPQFAAGALIGLAVLSEYPSAVAAIVLLGCALPRLRTAGLIKAAAGGAPFAIILGLYNALAFGSPFILSSGNERSPEFRALASHGLFGIGLPSLSNLLGLLADPGRGLFVFSPVLLVALALLPSMRRRIDRGAFLALTLAPLALLLTYAGYPNWHGGWTVGGRYLVAVMPFLVAPLLAGAEAGRSSKQFFAIEPALAGASILAVVLTSLVFPFVPNAFHWPWASFALPILMRGFVAPNLFHLISTSMALVVPFALCAAALMTGVERKWWLSALAGSVLWMAIGMAGSRQPTLGERLQLGYVEEVYFEGNGSLEEAAPPDLGVPPRLRLREGNELRLPPPSWPF
jgi:hypothetical protein